MRPYNASKIKGDICLLISLIIKTKFLGFNFFKKLSVIMSLAKNGYSKLSENISLKHRNINFSISRTGGLGILSVECYEPIVFNHIKNRSGELFVDIGANVGCYSILASFSFSKVIAVEPGKNQKQLLLNNLAKNSINNVFIIENAVGSFNGEGKLYESKMSVNNSLINVDDDFQEVNVMTLDALLNDISSIDLLKIDVEGAELEVIKSGINSLEKIEEIIIEVREEFEVELLKIMNNYNFICYLLEDRKKIKEKNLLFSIHKYDYLKLSQIPYIK